MSFGLSSNYGAKAVKVSSVSGWSIATTLISPLIAVCLSHYLHTHEKQQTTFALPIENIDARLLDNRPPAPRLESPIAPDTPGDHAEVWQAFASQPEKQARARKLIDRAGGVKVDPADRIAMLRLAKEIATQANDGRTAFEAIEALAETSRVDADAMRTAVLTRLASAARLPAQHKSIAEQALKLADQAVGQNHFMAASQLGKLALSEAKKSPDRELTARAQGQIAEVAEQLWARAADSQRMSN